MKRATILTVLILVLVPTAHAQTPPMGDSAKDMLGPWEFSNADRNKRCTATFRNTAVKGGFKVEFDANCGSLFPLVNNVAGWIFPDNDLLRLVDAQGVSLAEFSEVENGIYEAPTPGVGVLFLQNAASAGPTPKPPAELTGEWTMRRGNAVLCALTMTANAAGEGLALVVKPGCAPSVAQLGFTQWRLDRDELLLVPARGNAWRFEEIDGATWRRLPETADPITLVRQ